MTIVSWHHNQNVHYTYSCVQTCKIWISTKKTWCIYLSEKLGKTKLCNISY